MASFVTVALGGLTSTTLDAGQIIRRVANLLRRDDIDLEIMQWLNFAMTEFTDRIDFPELLTDAPVIDLTVEGFSYDLPLDFARAASVFYRDTTNPEEYGRHLIPLPREYYEGDVIDIRRLTHGSSLTTGDPVYFFVLRRKLHVYPALPAGKTGKLELKYYKIPAVLTAIADVPAIDYRWRMYLIWLTLFWGKVMQEQDESSPNKISLYSKKKDLIIAEVRGLVRGVEAPREERQTPSVGMDFADSIFD